MIKDSDGQVLDDDAIEAAIDKAIVEHDMNKLVDYVLEGGTDRLRDKVIMLILMQYPPDSLTQTVRHLSSVI